MSYDEERFFLGSVCKRGHEYIDGKNLRYKTDHACVQCRRSGIYYKPDYFKKYMKSYEFPQYEYVCDFCNKKFFRKKSYDAKLKHKFCCMSHWAKFTHKYKKSGYRRSKIEKYLEYRLLKTYKELKFSFNDRKAIGTELDIYVFDLKLAIEVNGIVHYEPIYGQEKFEKIQKRDENKKELTKTANIELVVIDTRKLTDRKCFNIIRRIINAKLKK